MFLGGLCAMIQVENLTKYYGDLAAIKDVSFNVDKGVDYSDRRDGNRTGCYRAVA